MTPPCSCNLKCTSLPQDSRGCCSLCLHAFPPTHALATSSCVFDLYLKAESPRQGVLIHPMTGGAPLGGFSHPSSGPCHSAYDQSRIGIADLSQRPSAEDSYEHVSWSPASYLAHSRSSASVCQRVTAAGPCISCLLSLCLCGNSWFPTLFTWSRRSGDMALEM